MAKPSRTKAAGERQVLVHYDQALPEIPDRLPHELPSSYLEKDSKGGYRIVSGRRATKKLLVPKRFSVEHGVQPGRQAHRHRV